MTDAHKTHTHDSPKNVELTKKDSPTQPIAHTAETLELPSDSLRLLETFFAATLDVMLVVNEQRQIVFASQNVRPLLVGVKDIYAALGMRPGAAVDCIHANTCAGGCGTSPVCPQCGAFQAIVAGLNGTQTTTECRLTRKKDGRHESFNLRVKSTPIELNGRRYAILALSDISSEKRRQYLEKNFLHDLMRDVFTLEEHAQKLSESLVGHPQAAQVASVRTHIAHLSERVLIQHDIAQAEGNTLSTTFLRISPESLLRTLLEQYRPMAEKTGCTLQLDANSSDHVFYTDIVLLRRVLGLLLSNAIEAASPRDVILIGAQADETTIVLWVNNPATIPQDAQPHVFTRGYSTKSPCRGFGTYTARLITTHYLFGNVSFSSDKQHGTTFKVELPLNPPPCAQETEEEHGNESTFAFNANESM